MIIPGLDSGLPRVRLKMAYQLALRGLGAAARTGARAGRIAGNGARRIAGNGAPGAARAGAQSAGYSIPRPAAAGTAHATGAAGNAAPGVAASNVNAATATAARAANAAAPALSRWAKARKGFNSMAPWVVGTGAGMQVGMNAMHPGALTLQQHAKLVEDNEGYRTSIEGLMAERDRAKANPLANIGGSLSDLFKGLFTRQVD